MTSLLDFSSSPDPLGDEVPSSVMPSARRNAGNLKSIARESSVQYSGSSNRTKSISKPISTRKSPRKQTFELDVGNGRSPQRLLVTVEAEHERGQRGAVSRRLFNASPTRSVSRRREGTTTTTTVPLRGLTDDEADETGNVSTVRRRGRPRVSLGSKNGTPAPRGKKRAGTPLTKTSSAKRHSGEAPSETDLENTALLESSQNAAVEPTPKPKTRTKKTPKKAGTPAVPSSNPTGRKRGRPRKALMPEEVADLNSEADRRPDNTSILPSDNVPMTEEIHMDGAFDGDDDRRMSDFATSQIGDVRQPSATREDTTRLRTGQRGVRFSSPIARYSEAFDEVSSHQGRADESDAPMFDDYTGEVHSDVESETEGVDGATYSGPDNLTHASEFSMINVEELPSFQASLQSNRSGIIDQHQPFPEAGDETNMIINQTLESLRRSTQTEADGHSHIEDAQNRRESIQTTAEHESADHTRNSRSAFGSSQSSWMQSPRRPPRKSMPLSRQVFSNKAPHVDDSFSELPDSILRAATPGRLPMKPVTTHVTDEYSNMDEYEDEFSQIPDEVLEAATPRPPRMERRVDHNTVENVPSLEEEEEEEEEAQSNSRSTNIGSDRLPTPDDTNSSTTDAKNIHGEEAHKMPVDSSAVANTSELNIRSSPPTISRQMNTMTIQPESGQTITRHFDTMALVSDASRQTDQEDHAETQRNKGSSPAAPLQNSGSPGQTRKSPSPVRRPTLSPIVRVGRTLQNIMSDRSSPDEHGSSLASPFRGPGQNDSRQSSIARSPVRNGSHRGTGSDGQTPFNPLVSVTQNIRSAFGSMRQTAPVPAPVPAPTEAPSVREENGSFAADMAENLRIEAPGRSARSNEIDQAYDLPQHENLSRGLSSSLRAAAVGRQGDENELTSALDENEISSPANQRSRRLANSSAVGTLSSLQNQVQEDGDEEEEQQEMYEEDFDDLFNLEEDGNVEGQEPAQDEEIGQEQGLEPDEVAGIEPEMEPEEEQDEEPADTTAAASDEDDMDLWDIEASRPTPRSTKALRAEAQERRQSQIPPENPASADTSIQAGEPAAAEPVPPRRNKIPSPWRRNPRRLIYQDDFRSPAELEMEDSPPSEGRPVPTMQPPAVQEQDMEFEGTEEEFSRSREEDAKDEHDMNQYGDQDEDEEPDHFQAGQDFADDGSYELMEEEELDEPQSLPRGQGYPQKDAPLVENSVLQEYSMISEPGKPSGPVSMQDPQDKPVSARKSFFGRFDIMSFFSSPRPPPVTNNPPTAQVEETPAAHKMNGGPLPQSIRSEKSVQDEPQSALRATGLFPTIKQKIFNPSPARTVDLFSPGTDLRSNDTVADTYAESPSTPDRQDFPQIPQKRNFTPLSAQSRNTASLFTPSHQGSTPDRDTHTPSPSYDDLREPEYSDEDEYSGEQESASTDDGPSFEHIPPREKPSHWDKNLSPAKSSMRSPLKPKTPGRVVAFTNSVANSDPTSEDQNDQQEMLTTIINGSAKIATSNPRTAILNPTPLRIPASYRGPEQDTENALSPIKPLRQVNQPLPVTRAQVSPQMKLSPTVWTRGHWVRLDEILQLRQRDPMQFQMVFPSVGLGKHPLSGLEVATHDAQMILEDWHMQVVEAFRSELLADSGVSPDADDDETHGVWDANSLSKRLFALMVGEERRRTGKYVSGQSHLAGISSRKGKEIAR
ncbi:hypothetical protein PFICI_08952 [Pestalotiopsis fici W106-1]|uniref:Uncharacterized protein n=1 Tax=Pestalotiopsis fici (strain W106-1 / CGMCC3.15140) TaxID=1229662 RepID=W3WZ89_PESFW|nr:uncharacterized protein PFICI_08952 [Pestalotiopsis fici W106-1]ETS79099.1 hypothetical protein PFICI_08952 [Pestalotiopsis fici W106-1]